MSRAQLGRRAILDAAMELFATRGVDGVSLGDIHRASGHRNRSAATYHFGGKHELVEALLTEVVSGHDARRVQALDRLEVRGGHALREVLEASVSPLADDLDDRRGRLSLRMAATVIGDERYMAATQTLMRSLPGLGRATAQISSHLDHLPATMREERIVLATSFGMRAFADQARLIDSPAPTRAVLPNDVFVDHIVVLLHALLTAPPPSSASSSRSPRTDP